jgi:hypothetical protein
MPWRVDGAVFQGPLVSFNGDYASPYIPNCPDGTGIVTPDPYKDGSILGAPHPYHGAAYWNHVHEVWKTCRDSEDNHIVPYLEGYGEYAPFAHATQWVTKHDGEIFPQFCQYGHLRFDGTTLWGGKYAQTIMRRPSINWNRPCNFDRFQVLPETSTCIKEVDLDAQTITFEDYLTPAPGFEESDVVYICGLGVWKLGGKISDYVYNLGTQLMTQAQLDSIGASVVRKCGTGVCVKLRWTMENFAYTCEPIEISIVDTSANPVRITLAAPCAMMSGDRVAINGVSGVNGAPLISNLDGASFCLSEVSGSGLPAYTGGGTASCVFAPDTFFNDSQSKGTFVYKEWTNNFRDVAEYERLSGLNFTLTGGYAVDCDAVSFCGGTVTVPPAPRPHQAQWGLFRSITDVKCETHCLPWTPCNPQVMCVSPNTGIDHFPNGKTFPFPATFELDGAYTSHWGTELSSERIDPFYNGEPCSCADHTDFNAEITYKKRRVCAADDGTCKDDEFTINEDGDVEITKEFFPYPPLTENVCEPPVVSGHSTRPLPVGTYVGCLPQDKVDIPTQPSGNVCSYPLPGVGVAAPWVIYLAELGCACSQGKWWQEYEANKSRCRGNNII